LPKRVIIQQNTMPHYRARIFELLSQCDRVNFIIVADTGNAETPFLQTLQNFEDRNIRHVPVKTKVIKLPGIPVLTWQPDTLRIIWKERPAAIIAMGSPYSVTAWLLGLMGRALGIPVIMWGHGLLNFESGPKWWIRLLFYRLAAAQLLYGDHARKLLMAKGFDPDTLYVVYNSLDYDRQQAIMCEIKDADRQLWREELGVKVGEGLVTFTGRLQRVKRLDLLILAVAELAARGRRVHVALIGEGSERKNLEQLSRERGVTDLVHFLGANYNERFLGLALSTADLSVVPSGAGLSVMHAMTYGTPVLIHDRIAQHFPEWEAVEEGVTGFYYKYDDTHDLAVKIEQAIFPVPAKSRMAENCRRVISERYNPHRQVQVFVKAVEDVLCRA
jgi:glycosyltransferase involved in cell wall biosynthesis